MNSNKKLLVGLGIGCLALVLCGCFIVGGVAIYEEYAYTKYDKCMDDAYNSYVEEWNSKCLEYSMGEDTSGNTNCLLPQDIADELNAKKTAAETECDENYFGD